MPSEARWSLHPQLARDTVALGDLALSRVLVMNDAHYPWLVLVPRRPDMVEIIDLAEADQAALMREIAQTARALKTITKCHKLNIAALGNSVPQLHVHVMARFRNDAAGARPVWGVAPPRAYTAEALDKFLASLRGEIGLASVA